MVRNASSMIFGALALLNLILFGLLAGTKPLSAEFDCVSTICCTCTGDGCVTDLCRVIMCRFDEDCG